MKKVLVVDDNKENLLMLKSILGNEYQLGLVPSGKLALDYLEKKLVDLILLDVDMPEMSGLEVIDVIKSQDRLKNIPVLFLTGVESADIEVQCLEKGGDDYIRKPYDSTVLKRRMSRLIELYELRFNLESALMEKSRQLDRMSLSTIITIANTVDAKDSYTGGHSLRVAICARDIAKNMGWDPVDVQNVYNVALLHDIGKIAVPDAVLNKPGRLTDEEFEVIKQHPVTGNEILKDITILDHVQEGAHYHHERWDGRGYPSGLSGEDIPIYARIIAVADTYDAMRSDRVYRKHLSTEKIISEFERCKGSQFDPQIADVFVFMLRDGYDIDPDMTRNRDNSQSKIDDSISLIRTNSRENYAANKDSLNGLFNRSYMNIKVGNRIIKDRRGALLLIDMDNFRSINEKYGYNVGDDILHGVENKLKELFREEDIITKMNGDAFAVFMSGSSDAEYIRTKVQKVIDSIRKSDLSEQYDKMVSVSIGIAMCPDDGITFEELYSAADSALDHGRKNGISMYHFYGSEEDKASIDNSEAYMKHIKDMIEEKFADDRGALSVEYDDFQSIYNYVYRYVDRNDTKVQVILFTITPSNGNEIELSVLEQSMHDLDIAVVDSLRKVDVGTRYNGNQYIVILTDTDEVNGTMVANRVTEYYYKLSGDAVTKLSYELETLRPNKGE